MRAQANFRKLGLAATAGLAILAGPGRAQATLPNLGGTWLVSVQLADCTSGAAVAPPFTSLLAFTGTGTETEVTNNPALQPGQRTTGLGVWTFTSANHYHLNAYALILFPSTTGPHPIAAGSQQIHQDIVLNINTWTSKATIQFFDLTGKQTGAGCATATAARLM
jgi:hypothetical protein